MVFARKTDDALASLVKEIDRLVAANQDKKAASFVNFLGPDADQVQEAVEQFEKEHQPKNVALVVPVDHENGPQALKISPDADVTVMIYRGTKVEANHAVPAGKLTADTVKEILRDTVKVLQ